MLKLLKSWIIYIMFAWILCCQGLFILIQGSFGEKVVDSIQGQLRQELAVSNFNYLARSITDFTVSGAIECGVLDKKTPFKTKIIDLRYMAKNCTINMWSLNGIPLEVLLKSLNGDEYEFKFISKNPDIFYFALWGFRLLGLAAIWGIAFAVKAKSQSQIEIAQRMKSLALEVSHDIRSPLSSLSMTLREHVFNDPEERKVVLGSLDRINDIANNLLSINRRNAEEKKYQNTLLIPLINSIVSEKRIQFKDLKQLNIVTAIDCSPFTSVLIDESLFRRALSNILNNAIDAVVDDFDINISLEARGDKIAICVEDFGCGIPQDLLNNIGQRGFSTKSEANNTGHGIGLSSSIEAISKFDGKLKIDSIHMQGTRIEIVLPLSSSPEWLIKEINIDQYDEIWILDDDPSIHFFWKNKLNGYIRNFSNIKDFKDAFNKSIHKNVLYLIDYELGDVQTGLQLIDELSILKSSVLVTSVFDQRELQNSILSNDIKVIPKYLIESILVLNSGQDIFDAVFIDDDSILRLGWSMKAKKNNIKLLTLTSISEFNDYSSQISKDRTKIYIDSNLGDMSIRGEVFAEKLHKEGFKKIYLTTGYEKECFSSLVWLNIQGKGCPF